MYGGKAGAMRRSFQALRDFWFPEVPAKRLALLRIATGSFSLWYVGTRFDMLDRIGETSHILFDPVGLARILSNPIPADAFQAIVAVTLIANIVFILGWRHRWIGPLFALLLLFTLSYRNSWSMIYHSRNIVVLHVLILGFVRSADAFSLDSARRRRSRLEVSSSVHWQYGWPIQLLCAVTVATYCVAGVAKVAGELGWSWIVGEALRNQIAVDALRKELLGGRASPLAFALYDQIWLFSAAGAGTLLLELGAPLALLHKRLSRLWVLGAFSMHWGIFLVMGIQFRYQLSGLIFLSFFEIDHVIAAAQSKVVEWVRGLELFHRPPSAGSIDSVPKVRSDSTSGKPLP